MGKRLCVGYICIQKRRGSANEKNKYLLEFSIGVGLVGEGELPYVSLFKKPLVCTPSFFVFHLGNVIMNFIKKLLTADVCN